MQIEKSYKPETAASSDPTRFVLHSVRLDASKPEAPILVSTDGRMLIAVPVAAEEGETLESRTIPINVFPAARKAAGRAFSYCTIGINGAYTLADGSTFPGNKELEDSAFPDWRQVVPAPGRPGAIKLTIDPHRLKAIADGLGVGKGESLTLEIVPDGLPMPDHDTIKTNGEPVRITASKAPGAFAVLMPMRSNY